MKNSAIKVTSALASAALLVGAGATITAPALAADGATAATDSPYSHEASGGTAIESGFVEVANVVGTFSYDQNVITPTSTIASAFQKGAATLCASLPSYGTMNSAPSVKVEGTVSNSFEATVDEMASDENAQSYVIGCACASNLAGGGAIANAEVSGVTIESVAEMAGAE